MNESGQFVKQLGDAWQESVLKQTCLSVDEGKIARTIRFLGYDREGRAVNQADIWLTSEQLPLFIDALVTYPMPLPTDYLQTAEHQDNGFRVQIRSHESPKVFMARLFAALGCFEQTA
ncbi:hypothetical protein [Planococcus sp. ISL-109]|uniref:hypothetical protein n=1 Tax=Planococcus sp. ISL-109 TaxID=2819166 RepID=UPI001BEB42C3|nr:hypothetical protein [Planococcus sp. ISL-109]MBT2583430.1 hypothetical protein [Planococcus sp. ISL-109]